MERKKKSSLFDASTNAENAVLPTKTINSAADEEATKRSEERFPVGADEQSCGYVDPRRSDPAPRSTTKLARA